MPLDANADINGDGKTDYVVMREPGGDGPIYWYTLFNGGTTYDSVQWGSHGDHPIIEDFDGDGKDDIAVWRPGDPVSTFFILNSIDNTFRIVTLGGPFSDPSVSGDYDGDGKADPTTYSCPSAPRDFYTLVTLGDSLTYGAGTSNPPHDPNTYPNKLKTILTEDTGKTWLLKDPGTTSRGGIDIDSVNVEFGQAAIDFYRDDAIANVAIVWAGTNDFALGNDPVAAVESGALDLCQSLRAAGFTVYFLNILPRTSGFIAPMDAATFEMRRVQFNAQIAAHLAGIATVVNVAGNANLLNPANTTYFTDQIHLTPAGYAIVASLAAAAINSTPAGRNKRGAGNASLGSAGNCYYSYIGSKDNPDHVTTAVQWGVGDGTPAGNPSPAVGDFDGDDKYDFCVQRQIPGGTPGSAEFVILRSSDLGSEQIPWGITSDTIEPGDYDGDGKTDITVVRNISGGLRHYILFRTGSYAVVDWGATGDIPVPGDYDGDGSTDVAVFRPVAPSGGTTFFSLNVQNGTYGVVQWGACSAGFPCDFPVANWNVH